MRSLYPVKIVRSIWSSSDFFRIFYASCTAYSVPKQYQMLELMCNTLKDSKMAGAKNYFLPSFVLQTQDSLRFLLILSSQVITFPGGTPHHGLYGEASPGKDTFFRTRVHKRVGISIVEVYERIGKSVVLVCNNGHQMHFLSAKQFEKTFCFCDLLMF